MKINKKLMAKMPKAYSVCPLTFRGEKKIVAATEKDGPINLFDLDGNLEETIIEDFGGVMSIVPLENEDESFLTTYKFYSPNDGYEASIVHVKKIEGKWSFRKIVDLPFVHRFDLLRVDNKNYLIACTIKSGFEFRNDWNQAGKLYVGLLPDDLDQVSEENPLELEVLHDKLTKNHGYYRVNEEVPYSLISSVEGVFKVIPPHADKPWQMIKLLDQSTSDILYYDLDGDGKKELVTFSEFHGDHLDIFKENADGEFERTFAYKKPLKFLHALYACPYEDKTLLVVGHREGERDLFGLYYDPQKNDYVRIDIDTNVGVANVSGFYKKDKLCLVACHRETDQVLMYDFE
ncbi:MAG: hypothetical protein Q4E50_04685 [Tissierellia bacterium]|nr:hypothetical protein [Tissierellia bacterium]